MVLVSGKSGFSYWFQFCLREGVGVFVPPLNSTKWAVFQAIFKRENGPSRHSGHPATVKNGPFKRAINQKNPRVRKIFVRNSGAGNGCANFMDAWKKSVRSARKAMSIKFLVLGGGGVFWVLGGGECRFYFYGREDFSELNLL